MQDMTFYGMAINHHSHKRSGKDINFNYFHSVVVEGLTDFFYMAYCIVLVIYYFYKERHYDY